MSGGRPRILVGPGVDGAVCDLIDAAGVTELLSTVGDVILSRHRDTAGFARELNGVDAVLLLNTLPTGLVLPRLRVVSVAATGHEYYVDARAMHQHDVDVTFVPAYGAHAIAEHALALALALAKNIPKSNEAVRSGGWPQVPSIQLAGGTAGVVGLGSTGIQMVHLLEAVGMHVIVWSRRPDPVRLAGTSARFVGLDDLFERSRIISLHLALTSETTGIVDARLLARAAPRTVVVNTARAAIVEPGALEAAVASGQVLAAVDVFPTEPPTPAHLRALPTEMLLSPHAAYNTPEAVAALVRAAADNIVAYLSGTPKNVVPRPT